ncbi:MAG: NADPH-dependent F420 reductase [Solirubrobacterales bacterium]
MRIGVIGSGKIGSTAARLFADSGHEIAIANSRGPETLGDLVGDIGQNAIAATVEEAASFGDVVLVAIPFGAYAELPAEALTGRVVIDATNYYPNRDGNIAELDDDSTTSSEMLAGHAPGAKVVKSFNTMNWQVLRDRAKPGGGDDRLAIFLAGDDAEAKSLVAGLIEEIGFAPVDTGGLAEGGRRQQPGSALYNKPVTESEGRGALAGMDD